jgi:hypothetical protein
MPNDEATNDEATNDEATNDEATSDEATSDEATRRPTGAASVHGRDAPPSEPALDPWQALFEEWFVTYNPLPLASAALVLFGLWIASREIARLGVVGALGVAAIAELYALALVAGAWVLRTHGHRRAAVLLGLLAALYQCDVTLHVETSAYLGTIGLVASLAWLALFALKLELLTRALELELSRPARWVPLSGAAAIALLPHAYRALEPRARGELVALVLYAVGALALSTSRDVRARSGFDVRGRRAILGVQVLFAAAALAHLAYACSSLRVPGAPLVASLALVALRAVRSEVRVWLGALGVVLATALLRPETAPVVAVLAGAALALHAVRARAPEALLLPERVTGPTYRGAPIDALGGEEISLLAARPTVFVASLPEARLRLGLGALALGHLGVTGLVTDGPTSLLSTHHAALDVALALVTLALLVWTRRAWTLAPLALGLVHLSVVEGWLLWPRDALELGVWAISLGFSTLGISIALSVRAGAGRDPAHVPRERAAATTALDGG